MAEIKQLEYKYTKDYREVFEDITTLMFCTELGLEKGVNRRINQRAIESDPVLIDGKRYAYQAKYYDASTKLSDHKQDLIKSIEGAASSNVTDLYLYINKDLPDKNPSTGKETGSIQEIENAASQLSISLYWRTLSWIETSLDMPKYSHIKNQYFGFGKNIRDYYDYVVKLYEKPTTGNTLLGEESLAELYMQPSYYKSESEIGDVEQLFDEFVSNRECGVLWIVGEPGHGKTSMCIKAVADYRNMKRYLQTKGVFWFRLNPQGIPGMVKPKMLALEKVFSWGRITGNRSNMIEPGKIEGSLIFLDGFDELKSSLEEYGISSNQFYEQVNQLAQEYQMHIVITSRTRALEQVGSFTEDQLRRGAFEITCNLSDGGVLKNNVKLLSPLTEEKQTAWINELISLRENKGIDTSDLGNYKHTFKALQENEDIAGLLKVPILLRMIVQNYFEPSSDNRVKLYRELFDKTLLRQGLGDQSERLHSIYREIAFRVFVYDDDCTEMNRAAFKGITDSDAFLYQYYLHTPKSESEQDKTDKYRITFIHRSFYQYFLSEFFYEKLKSVTDGLSGENFLKYLWPRHIDPYVLDNLRLRTKKEEINYTQVLRAIIETDAFLSEHEKSSDSKKSIGNYDKANNVFWNAISICNSIFQNKEFEEKFELSEQVVKLISKYNSSGILLKRSFMENANLNNALLNNAVMSDVNLSHANLSHADLRQVTIVHSTLININLHSANLEKANLSHSIMYNADMSFINLKEADMNEVDLSNSKLNNANLSHALMEGDILKEANLSSAFLVKAKMEGVDLKGADLNGAQLVDADLKGARLRGANLSYANLSHASLANANLRGANLSYANLSNAFISGTNLRGANLSYANLSNAILINADLRGANLKGTIIDGIDLSSIKLKGANLRDAIISNSRLYGTRLSITEIISLQKHMSKADKELLLSLLRKTLLVTGSIVLDKIQKNYNQ